MAFSSRYNSDYHHVPLMLNLAPATLASLPLLRASSFTSQPVPLLVLLPEMPFPNLHTVFSLNSFRFYSNHASERPFLTTLYK